MLMVEKTIRLIRAICAEVEAGRSSQMILQKEKRVTLKEKRDYPQRCHHRAPHSRFQGAQYSEALKLPKIPKAFLHATKAESNEKVASPKGIVVLRLTEE
jgi:hypothetical protein